MPLYDPVIAADTCDTAPQNEGILPRCDDCHARDIAQIFIECRPGLLKLAESILCSRHAADDVVQDAFLKAIHAAKITKIKKPVSYLHRIIRNLAIDRLRKETLERRNFTDEEEGLYISEPTQNPETIVIDSEQLRFITTALEQLPPRNQKALMLYSIDGLTQREIAKMLKVSATLVNFMIRDALKHCRTSLSEAYSR